MRFTYLFPAWIDWRLLILMAALCCTSCSKRGYNSVHGKVFYQNEPIEGVVVTFHAKRTDIHTLQPVGQTKEDGTFTLMTGKDEGAPEGEYVVTFSCPQPVEEKAGTKGRRKGMVMQKYELEDRFKGAYGNEQKSTFKVVIKSGRNELAPFYLK